MDAAKGHRSSGRKQKPARSMLGLLKSKSPVCRCTSSRPRQERGLVTLAAVISETVQGATVRHL